MSQMKKMKSANKAMCFLGRNDGVDLKYLLGGGFAKDCGGRFYAKIALDMVSSSITNIIIHAIFVVVFVCTLLDVYLTSSRGASLPEFLCLNIGGLAISAYYGMMHIKYMRMKNAIQYLWYFYAFHDIYDKDNVLYNIMTQTNTVIDCEIQKDTVKAVGTLEDLAFVYYWMSAVDDRMDASRAKWTIDTSAYRKWVNKKFVISNISDMMFKIASLLLYKENANLPERALSYYNKINDEDMGRILVDLYKASTETECIAPDGSTCNLFKDSISMLSSAANDTNNQEQFESVLQYIDLCLATQSCKLNHETYNIESEV